MKNNTLVEGVVAGVLLVIAILILNPFNFWMPNMMHIMLLVVVFFIFGIFATFIVREKNQDERDGVHRMMAGRTAFLVGAGVLLAGIVVQDMQGVIDSWLVWALIAMIITKIATRVYGDYWL